MGCDTSAGLLIYYYIKIARNIILIVAPIIFLVMSTIDFIGIVSASSEKDMGKFLNTFKKRLLILSLILLLPLLVNFVMSFTNDSNDNNCMERATKENIEKLEVKEEKIEKDKNCQAGYELKDGKCQVETYRVLRCIPVAIKQFSTVPPSALYTVNDSVEIPYTQSFTYGNYNYNFAGYYTDKNCTKRITTVPKGVVGNLVVYSKYSYGIGNTMASSHCYNTCNLDTTINGEDISTWKFAKL